MKKYLIFFLMMTMSVAFLSCDKDDKDDPPPQDDPPPAVPALVGTWRYYHPSEGWYDQFTFNMNNSGRYRWVDDQGFVETEDFNYSTSGKILTIVWAGGGSDSITYEIEGNELYLQFPFGTLIYIRQ